MPDPDPKAVLQSLIARLTPEVGNVTRTQLRREQWPGGRGHLADAVLRAREALASGEDQRIRDAVPVCLALERTGAAVLRRQAARQAPAGEETAKKHCDVT